VLVIYVYINYWITYNKSTPSTMHDRMLKLVCATIGSIFNSITILSDQVSHVNKT